MESLSPPKVAKPHRARPTPEQLAAFIEAAKGEPLWELPMLLGATTGARRDLFGVHEAKPSSLNPEGLEFTPRNPAVDRIGVGVQASGRLRHGDEYAVVRISRSHLLENRSRRTHWSVFCSVEFEEGDIGPAPRF